MDSFGNKFFSFLFLVSPFFFLFFFLRWNYYTSSYLVQNWNQLRSCVVFSSEGRYCIYHTLRRNRFNYWTWMSPVRRRASMRTDVRGVSTGTRIRQSHFPLPSSFSFFAIFFAAILLAVKSVSCAKQPHVYSAVRSPHYCTSILET